MFDTVLYQFLETGTSDRCLIYVSFNAWDSQVSSYPPFHFSFTVPLSLSTPTSDWVWAGSERKICATIARKINKDSGTGVVVEDVGAWMESGDGEDETRG